MPAEPGETFLLYFAPEQWTMLDLLSRFLGAPFDNLRVTSLGLRACRGHLDKFDTIARIANRLAHGVQQDYEELDQQGYSQSTRSKESAALYEVVVCELYSALDGLRTALFGIYKDRVQGIQNRSNEKLLARAARGEYGEGLPAEIAAALSSAYNNWFPGLRRIRTELQHGQVGLCYLDTETQQIAYMNPGIHVDGGTYLVKDWTGFLNQKRAGVEELLQTVCACLFDQLEPVESRHVCGMFRFRAYERNVIPSRSLSFGDGVCRSYQWFDSEPGYRCPMADRCLAYKRAIDGT